MRLGSGIGHVTLSRTVPAYEGGRFLLVTPFTRHHFQHRHQSPPGLSKEPSPVVYDNLGGGLGDTIGYVEGAEASMPFPQPTPVDATCVALIDDVFYSPTP